MIEAIIFDLDGLLVDSERYWNEARRAMATERGIAWNADDHRACMGMSTRTRLGELTGARYVVSSLSSDGLIGWDRKEFYRQPAREVTILDRIGAGDAMVGGVLHGWLQNDFAKALRYGALTAALALSQYGDQVITTRAEVEALLDQTSGDIVR